MNLKGIPLKVITSVLHAIRRLCTSRDNKTPDVIAIGGMLLGAQFLILAHIAVVQKEQQFDPMAYGGGAAALIAAIGAALRMKPEDGPAD